MTAQLDRRLLVVDDEVDICKYVSSIADREGFETAQAISHDSFKSAYADFDPTFIVMDLTLPDGDGIELLRFLKERRSQAVVVLISGFDQKVLNVARRLAEDYGLTIVGVLEKPILAENLVRLFRYDPEEKRVVDVDDLRRAIEEARITCLFQPKIFTAGLLASPNVEMEALVRWDHPTRGNLPPSEFLPEVVKSNLMPQMTRAVMKQALSAMREWENSGLTATVAVNVSPRLLNNVNLPDEFAEMAAEYGIPCARIIIEITEAAVMEQTVEATDILTRFRLKGFRLSLDDFGTGFSSLVRLYRLPFSELKIDQSFVRDLARSAEAQTIVRTIANLAHDLNLSVCAEGVEDAAAQDFVASCKCESMQGYFFSPPIPGDEIPAFFGHEDRRRTG